MAIETLQQLINVDTVESVVITDIEHDDDVGDYFREVRIFLADDLDAVLIIRVRSADQVKLLVGAPEQKF